VIKSKQTFLITAERLIAWRNPAAVAIFTVCLRPYVVWPVRVTWN